MDESRVEVTSLSGTNLVPASLKAAPRVADSDPVFPFRDQLGPGLIEGIRAPGPRRGRGLSGTNLVPASLKLGKVFELLAAVDRLKCPTPPATFRDQLVPGLIEAPRSIQRGPDTFGPSNWTRRCDLGFFRESRDWPASAGEYLRKRALSLAQDEAPIRAIAVLLRSRYRNPWLDYN